VFAKIRRVVIAGFCFVSTLSVSALTGRAQNNQNFFDHRNPGVVQTSQFSPFIITPPVRTLEKHVDLIRIGRLEFVRKSEYEQQADGRVPRPFDPLEMVRAQLGMGPNPAITISFDLKWHER